MREGTTLDVRAITAEQKFTQPPARYSEATLVKALEEDGIGRPSTYASIISVLQARDYVNKIESRFRPTILGRRLVDRLLHPAFDDILDVEYTAKMEEQLDEIEKGKADYKETLAAFYQKFKKDLKRATKEMPNFKEGQPLDPSMPCDKCGQGEMVEKAGRFGIFLACSRYPECDNTKELETADTSTEELDETCENCGRPMVVKRGRFGMFLACTGYPECKTTRKIISTKQGVKAAQPDQVLDETCPNCGKNLVVKHGPLRRVHGVHRLSRLQVREAEIDRRHLSQRRRRRRRAQVTPRESVLRLRQLPEVRLHPLEQAHPRAVPQMRVEVPHGKDHQALRPAAHLRQRGVRLRAGGGAGDGGGVRGSRQAEGHRPL